MAPEHRSDVGIASLEATLLKLRKSLQGWHLHMLGLEWGPGDFLDQEISYIKTSADIDKCVEQLAKQNLKIYGGTYVFWTRRQARHPVEDYLLTIRRYTSQELAVLSIAPEDKNNSTARVATGWEPPQEFVENELDGIDFVVVDRRLFWARDKSDKIQALYDQIP